MRPVIKGPQSTKYNPPKDLPFTRDRAADVAAVLGTATPTLDDCLNKVWLVVAKSKAKRPRGYPAIAKALTAIEPRVSTIYKLAGAPLLETLGEYCSYCEARLSALAEVEHAAPKAAFPTFATSWKNFLLACGPCNTSKKSQPSRIQLATLRGADLDADENVSYQELRRHYLSWPDENPDSCRQLEYTLEYLPQCAAGWLDVPPTNAFDVTNSIVRTDFNAGEVIADIPSLPALSVPVRLAVSSHNSELRGLISICQLNKESGLNPAYDRRQMNRTIALFDILITIASLNASARTANAFDPLWNLAIIHARSVGYYTLWIKLLSEHSDPFKKYGDTLADRFIVDTIAHFPNTDTSQLV